MSAGSPGDGDGFLARWSRRKQAAGAEPAEALPPEARPVAAEPTAPAEEPEVPLAELPPLEQIGPDFDIRPWLKRRLPAAWRQAALRRVWASDPLIRDFKGLADYDWDFHTPGALPGFGDLRPDIDIGRLLDQAIGRQRPAAPADAAAAGETAVEDPAATTAAPPPGPAESPAPAAAEAPDSSADTDNHLQDNLPIASRRREREPAILADDTKKLPISAHNDKSIEEKPPARRRGGAATPR